MECNYLFTSLYITVGPVDNSNCQHSVVPPKQTGERRMTKTLIGPRQTYAQLSV